MQEVYEIGIYLLVYFIILLVSRVIYDICTPYNLHDELSENDNPAISLGFLSYLFAISIIFVTAYWGPSSDVFLEDIRVVMLYSIIGIFLLQLSRFITDKCIFSSFSMIKEMQIDRNVGAASAQMGIDIANACIIGGAIIGEGGGLGSVFIFYSVGQVLLLFGAYVYNWITPYNVHRCLEIDNNSAVGISMSGVYIAYGICLYSALSFANFSHMAVSLGMLVGIIAVTFIVVPLLRGLIIRLLFRNISFYNEITDDHNWGIALLEAGILVASVGVFVLFIVDEYSIKMESMINAIL